MYLQVVVLRSIDWIDLDRDTDRVADSCECGDELSGSIKCGEFLDWLKKLLASEEGLCSIE